ncbi:MAG TPA: hypothetical protein VNJ08_00835 [Bacteriovoracaceae bacterium]|nr:hypothetical protein [Bacteriovoracaceae bacterium]
MKQLLALSLAFILTITSLMPLSAIAQSTSCENGECVQQMVDRLNDLTAVYKQQCLPKKELTDKEIVEYHEKNGLTEQCWKYITEITHLEAELQKHQTKLETHLGCENGECKGPDSLGDDLNSQLNALGKVEQGLSCNETKKQEIKNKCGDDLKCAFVSSGMGMVGYIAEKFVPASEKIPGCHMGDDSCATQLATGLIKSVYSFFEGAWDLLKAGGKYAGKKAGKFWKWVKGGDDHASTSQLAMAKASEDEGVFDMLMKDFTGTMSKLFEGLVAALKEWMKNDIFCEKWSAVPHFSKCEAPAAGFDCISCKGLVNGMCAITGIIIAEVVPAFLTGGMATAAKHGVNGAGKIAKLFSVSAKAMEAIKASRVGRVALGAATKVDDVIKVTKGLKIAKAAVEAALKAIKAYLMNPARKVLKTSLTALTELTKKGSVFLAETKTGKIIVFGGKALKTTGKIVIYPIDNPMTAWAFKAGERSFEKIFKLGAPKLVKASAVTSAITKIDPALESTLAKIESAKIPAKPDARKLLNLEEDLLAKVSPKRVGLLDDILASEKPNFDEIIKHLYPELQYGPLSSKLGAAKVLEAEKELLEEISKMANGPVKDELLKRFQMHVKSGQARNKIMGKLQIRPEDAYAGMKDVVVPEIKGPTLAKMMSDKNYGEIIIKAPVERRRSTAKALKLLENSGQSPSEAAATFQKFEKNFNHVLDKAPADSDSAAMLAEYIKRQRKAGVADEVIGTKLDDAFKEVCN